MRRALRRRFNRVRGRCRAFLSRERRTLRQKVAETQRRESLVAVLILAPLISLVTWVATTVDALPFLLFPPLAAAAYRLFAYPEKPGNFPWQFPLALTVGAASGAVSELVARTYFAPVPQGSFQVDPVTAGLTVLLAGGFLYLFDTELSPSLAVGLLLPFAGVSAGVYVANVSLASSFVAVAFSVWRTYLLD